MLKIVLFFVIFGNRKQYKLFLIRFEKLCRNVICTFLPVHQTKTNNEHSKNNETEYTFSCFLLFLSLSFSFSFSFLSFFFSFSSFFFFSSSFFFSFSFIAFSFGGFLTFSFLSPEQHVLSCNRKQNTYNRNSMLIP